MNEGKINKTSKNCGLVSLTSGTKYENQLKILPSQSRISFGIFGRASKKYGRSSGESKNLD